MNFSMCGGCGHHGGMGEDPERLRAHRARAGEALG